MALGGRAPRRGRPIPRPQPVPPLSRVRAARRDCASSRATASARLVGVENRQRRAGPVERRGHPGAVAHIAAMQDGASEPRRLERVVSAFRDQRAADKGDPGDAEHQPQFAKRVRQVDVGIAGTAPRAGCAGRCSVPALRSISAMASPRAGWRGAMIVSSPGCSRAIRTCAAAAISSSPGMRARGDPDRTIADPAPQRGKFRRIGGKRGSRRFQIPDARRVARAESAEPRGLLLVLRQAKRESLQHRPDQPRHSAPAPERARRQAAVEQQHRNAAAPRPEHQIGPQLGFDPDREIGTPMVEKPIHGARQVDGHELMPDAARQPPGEQPRRRHGSGRQQDFEAGALRERCARSGPAPSALRRRWRHGPRSTSRAAGRCRQSRSVRQSARGLPCRAGLRARR